MRTAPVGRILLPDRPVQPLDPVAAACILDRRGPEQHRLQ
jgi:hypothetical protein